MSTAALSPSRGGGIFPSPMIENETAILLSRLTRLQAELVPNVRNINPAALNSITAELVKLEIKAEEMRRQIEAERKRRNP